MNIPTFINNSGIETYIKPWHRPELVLWSKEELPSWILQEPVQFSEQCCCESFTGFGGVYFQPPTNAPAVPEASTWMTLVAGVLLIAVVRKWRIV